MSRNKEVPPTERTVQILEELLVWTKVGMYSAVEGLLRKQFEAARPEELLAYELLDGTRQQKEIIDICKTTVEDAKISTGSLSRWATKWEKLGLVRKDGIKVIRLFSLRDFGLSVPPLPEPTKRVSGTEIGPADQG